MELITTPSEHAGLLHPEGARGCVVLAAKDGDRWREIPVPVSDLPAAARSLAGRPDVYLTQNRFYGRHRRVNTVAQLDACWADLDYYKVPELADKHPLHIRDAALIALQDEGIPPFTFFVTTGRGGAPVWLLDPAPRQALPRWNLVQRQICAALSHLGADPNARDAPRVLRVAGTRNSKSGNLVEIVSPVGERWSFDALANEMLPHTREELQAIRERLARKVTRGPWRLPSDTVGHHATTAGAILWSQRLRDLHKFLDLHWWGELPAGQRDAWVFVAGCGMAWLSLPAVLRRDLFDLARKATGGAWKDRDTHNAICTVIKRAEAAARGERLHWGGRDLDPRYRFRTETILEWVGIAPEYQEHMITLASDELKAERRRKAEAERWHRRREAAGLLSRQEYLRQAEVRARELAAVAVALRSQGLTVSGIAQSLQTTERHVYRLLRQAKETPPTHGEGFANHTGRSNHVRVGEAGNGAACSEWGEEPAEDECALLSPAAAVAMEGRLAA